MKYYSDGFLRGPKNPSNLGGGYTIVDENGNLIKRVEVEKVRFSNNEAEILGILETMKLANDKDAISTDSMCCLTWARAGRSKARPDLNEIMQECRNLLAIKRLNLMWEGREYNLAGLFNENEQYERRKKYEITQRNTA